MTASAPRRSVSLCQTKSASWPSTSFAAWYASWSQFDPGKTMTAKRMVSADLNAITLDYRIRQQLVGNFRRHRPCFVSRLGRQLELEIFTLADVFDPAVPERVQCVDDRLALRIEYRRLQRDEHSRAH